MTAVKTRTFELMSTVTFQGLPADQLGSFAADLSSAVGAVLPDFPAVVAFVVQPDHETGSIDFGLRFAVVDTTHVEEMATDILHEAVTRVTNGAGSVEAEREESVLVLTR